MDLFRQELAYTASMEPVTLSEAKAACLVDYTTDDTYITALISQCRAAVEAFCHISITPKTITWTFDALPVHAPAGISRWDLAFYGYSNCTKWLRLPSGPVTSVTSVTVVDGTTSTTLTNNVDYFVRGAAFKEIRINSSAGTIIVVYAAQWPYDSASSEAIPADLKRAILEEIAFRYTNRGDATNRYAQQNVGISEGAQSLAKEYVQIWL